MKYIYLIFKFILNYHFILCPLAPDFTTLANELKEVANWLTLGVNLRIPYHELQRIQLVHGLRYSGLLEMLDMWLKSGHASWVSLTQALKKTGFRTLANRIALTYGK